MARPFIDTASPDHPSLIDQAHSLDALLGIVNVPSGVWIDEEGVIVRPPETAWTRTVDRSHLEIPPDATSEEAELVRLAKGLLIDGDPYVAAIRDWVEKGSESTFALDEYEVLRRSRPRPPEHSEAAANFEIGQHLHTSGHEQQAITFFRRAHELQPENWTYKRQAWIFVDPKQGPNDVYEGHWRKDAAELGIENYYPPFKP